MEDTKKKRIYDEKNLDTEELSFKNSNVKKGASQKVVSNKGENTTLDTLDKALNPLRKVDRAIDRISRPDYNDYRRNSQGINDISKLSDRELGYAKRDNKINGKDVSNINVELKSRKARSETMMIDQSVKQMYDIKTDKGDIKIGYNEKRDAFLISESKFDNNPNINIWREMDKGELSKNLINKGDLKNFDIESKPRNIENANIPKEKRAYIDQEIGLATSQSQSVNFTKELNSQDLRNPSQLIDSIVNTAGKGEDAQLYKVLGADDKNLTLRGLNTGDDRAFMVSVDAERKSALSRDVEMTGIIDQKTVLGYNKGDKDVYVGTVNDDKSIDWQQKGVYINNLDKGKKEEVAARIDNGEYLRNDVQQIGKLENGNNLYGAVNGNNDTVISADQSKWYEPDSMAGKQLASMAGLETGAISAIMNADKMSNSVNSNQTDVGMATAAEQQTSSQAPNQQQSNQQQM